MMIRNTIFLFLIICFICINQAESDRDEEGKLKHIRSYLFLRFI